jgi:hypothetical protein
MTVKGERHEGALEVFGPMHKGEAGPGRYGLETQGQAIGFSLVRLPAGGDNRHDTSIAYEPVDQLDRQTRAVR